MSFYQELPYPVLIGSGAVSTSGSTESLNSGQLALVDVKTNNVLSTSDLNAITHPQVMIAMGSYHTTDKLSKFIGGLKQSTKTQEFLGKDVMEFHYSEPLPLLQDIVQIGWDGVNNCDSLAFECGKSYRFKVSVSGEDVFRTFSRPLYRFIQFDTKCCANGDCVDACDDGVACKTYSRKLAQLINEDPELKFFVKAESVSSDFVATTPTHEQHSLSLCDNGDVIALAAVQTAYPTLSISRVSRLDSTSIYQTCVPLSTSITDFTPTASVLQAVCGTCPAGYTTVEGSNVYTIVRPLSGSENLVGGSNQAAFADVVADAYETALAQVIATSEVNTGTDVITHTAHGFVTGQPIVYSNGGSTTMAGLADATTYYAIVTGVNTFKVATTLANALVPTAIDITGTGNNAQSFTPELSSTFLSQNGSTALIQVKSISGVTLTALTSDTVLFSHAEPATCTPPANSAVSWVLGDQSLYRTTRTLCITVGRDCAGNNRLTELQAFYANTVNLASAITVSQAGTCADTYTVSQYSNACSKDGCLTTADTQYDDIQSFEGFVWEECPCPADSEEEDDTVNCGVRITGAYIDTKFGNCSFEPTDYFSSRPLRITVTQVDETGNPCDGGGAKVTRIQYGQVATQSGEWLVREYLKANSLEAYNIWSNEPRIREALDTQILNFIDRNKSYKVYYVVYTMNRNRANWATMHPSDKFETMIAFSEGVSTANFEALFGGYFSQFGVVLKQRGV